MKTPPIQTRVPLAPSTLFVDGSIAGGTANLTNYNDRLNERVINARTKSGDALPLSLYIQPSMKSILPAFGPTNPGPLTPAVAHECMALVEWGNSRGSVKAEVDIGQGIVINLAASQITVDIINRYPLAGVNALSGNVLFQAFIAPGVNATATPPTATYSVYNIAASPGPGNTGGCNIPKFARKFKVYRFPANQIDIEFSIAAINGPIYAVQRIAAGIEAPEIVIPGGALAYQITNLDPAIIQIHKAVFSLDL